MSTTQSWLEIIKPPSKKAPAGTQRSGGDGMNERGEITVGVQSSGGASEEKGTKMNLKQIKEKAKKHMHMCVECGCMECTCGAKKDMKAENHEFKSWYAIHKDSLKNGPRNPLDDPKSHAMPKRSPSNTSPNVKDMSPKEPSLLSKIFNRKPKLATPRNPLDETLNEAGIETAQDNDPKYSRDFEADRINYQFDNVFRNKFANPYLITTAVAAILERFSINCPVMHPSGRSESFVLHIHSHAGADAFVYIAIERDGRGQYDAFVQLVDAAGLAALHNLVHVHEHEDAPVLPDSPSKWILQQRHTGNI
jgi:hypothetical protein